MVGIQFYQISTGRSIRNDTNHSQFITEEMCPQPQYQLPNLSALFNEHLSIEPWLPVAHFIKLLLCIHPENTSLLGPVQYQCITQTMW